MYEKLGVLRGTLSGLGMDVELATTLSAMTADIVGSSEIEGIVLDAAQVRSSLAVRLGLEREGAGRGTHYVWHPQARHDAEEV